jgi:hypothetical protein
MRHGWYVENEKLRTNLEIFKINESMPLLLCKN